MASLGKDTPTGLHGTMVFGQKLQEEFDEPKTWYFVFRCQVRGHSEHVLSCPMSHACEHFHKLGSTPNVQPLFCPKGAFLYCNLVVGFVCFLMCFY